MKGKALLLLAAAAGVGGFIYLKSRKPVLGVTDGTAFQKGLVSGKMYPLGVGETGPGGTLHSVFSPDDPGLLLITFVAGPSGNSLTAQNDQAPPEAVTMAIRDFGFS